MSNRSPKAVIETRAALYAAMADTSVTDQSCIRALILDKAWSIAGDTLDLLAKIIDQMKPQHILEFGSGVSTISMALSCQRLSLNCLITSIDHDPKFSRSTEQQFARLEVNIGTRFSVAPLVVREFGGKQLPAYFLEEADACESIPADLVLIDGPPLLLGGREGVLYQVMNVIRPGTLILLDDANRAHELEIISKWQDNLGEAIEVHRFPNFEKGLASIIAKKPVVEEKLWSHKLNLTAIEIAGIIPKQSRVILVDEMQWSGSLEVNIRIMPFLERCGEYWGTPPNDQVAASELERLRAEGAEFIIFGWPAFWWLSHYCGFHDYLTANFKSILRNDRLIVFDLRQRYGLDN